MVSALDIYFSSLIGAAESATGAPLEGGTVIASEGDRSGTRSATSYPTPAGTIVWCDPALVDTLAAVLDGAIDRAIDSEEFARRAAAVGAALSGFGANRVLDKALRRSAEDPSVTGVSVRVLDRARAHDLALISELASVTSKVDRDEAGLDLDDLDADIVGLLDGEQLVAYASGLPYWINERFDDIGVLTHPDHRRRGLGVLAVSEFVRHRLTVDPQRLMLYRCRSENAGSNAVAESLGFTFAHTVGTVRFP